MYYKHGNPAVEHVFASRPQVVSLLSGGQAVFLEAYTGLTIYLARGDVLKKTDIPRVRQLSIDDALRSFGFDRVTAAEITELSKKNWRSKEIIEIAGSMQLPDLFFEKVYGETGLGTPESPFDAHMLLKMLQEIKEAGTAEEYGFGVPGRREVFNENIDEDLFYFYSYEDFTLSGNKSSSNSEAVTELYAFDDLEGVVNFSFGFLAGARIGS